VVYLAHLEARELLAPVYGWFTEGFDTRDLKEAKVFARRAWGGRQRRSTNPGLAGTEELDEVAKPFTIVLREVPRGTTFAAGSIRRRPRVQ